MTLIYFSTLEYKEKAYNASLYLVLLFSDIFQYKAEGIPCLDCVILTCDTVLIIFLLRYRLINFKSVKSTNLAISPVSFFLPWVNFSYGSDYIYLVFLL